MQPQSSHDTVCKSAVKALIGVAIAFATDWFFT
jgi:hypothetical protein